MACGPVLAVFSSPASSHRQSDTSDPVVGEARVAAGDGDTPAGVRAGAVAIGDVASLGASDWLDVPHAATVMSAITNAADRRA
jgi:hypothetical protein